jgi:uncharacterized protein (DUF1015 family)
MATLIPFKGIRYNPTRIDNLSAVTTPPYDVISEPARRAYQERHPHNIIRLIQGRPEGAAGHAEAAEYYRDWLETEVLTQDRSPSLYLTEVAFSAEGRRYRRLGLVGAVRLEPFSRGIILPHERTYSGIKSERLSLMRHCHANFSPIFALFSDPAGMVEGLREAAGDRPPDQDFIDEATGHRHRLWRITDPDAHQRVGQEMAAKRIYIADGHHRYETALAYRDWVAARTPDWSPDHPASFMMMSLTALEDGGLVIFPAHRLLRRGGETLRRRLGEGALAETFSITTHDIEGTDGGQWERLLRADGGRTVFGIVIGSDPVGYRLALRPGVMDRLFADTLPPALRSLDVSVLTQLLLIRELGFDEDALDDEGRIGYRGSADEALASVRSGDWEAACLLNPTRIDQVREVAESGLIMPPKSTYFYPKVITGQVINPLTP